MHSRGLSSAPAGVEGREAGTDEKGGKKEAPFTRGPTLNVERKNGIRFSASIANGENKLEV